MTIAIFANSAGWKATEARDADAEVGAVGLRADPRHAREQSSSSDPGRAIT